MHAACMHEFSSANSCHQWTQSTSQRGSHFSEINGVDMNGGGGGRWTVLPKKLSDWCRFTFTSPSLSSFQMVLIVCGPKQTCFFSLCVCVVFAGSRPTRRPGGWGGPFGRPGRRGGSRVACGGITWPEPRCMTARDRLRAWDVNFLGLLIYVTHKSCGIIVASWGFAHCIGTRLVFYNFFSSSQRKEDKWSNAKNS